MGRKSQYTPEFRDEAVRLWHESGLSMNKVADDLGIASETLRSWVRVTHPAPAPHMRRDAPAGSTGTTHPAGSTLTGDERAELLELRRRVRVLETEREILRKAAAFFAQESERTR
jgi:transposase